MNQKNLDSLCYLLYAVLNYANLCGIVPNHMTLVIIRIRLIVQNG